MSSLAEGRICGIACTKCNALLKWVRPETADDYVGTIEAEAIRKAQSSNHIFFYSSSTLSYPPLHLLIWGANRGCFQAEVRDPEARSHCSDEPTLRRIATIEF